MYIVDGSWIMATSNNPYNFTGWPQHATPTGNERKK